MTTATDGHPVLSVLFCHLRFVYERAPPCVSTRPAVCI